MLFWIVGFALLLFLVFMFCVELVFELLPFWFEFSVFYLCFLWFGFLDCVVLGYWLYGLGLSIWVLRLLRFCVMEILSFEVLV